MSKWEYGRLVVHITEDLFEASWELADPGASAGEYGAGADWYAWFHRLGLEGWEYVGETADAIGLDEGERYYHFKRPL